MGALAVPLPEREMDPLQVVPAFRSSESPGCYTVCAAYPRVSQGAEGVVPVLLSLPALQSR